MKLGFRHPSARSISVTTALVVAAIIALWAAPAVAQSLFQVGETVVAVPGSADAACLTQAALERYDSATDICAMGHSDECQVAHGLETSGACGFHYGVYVVTSIDVAEGWIQISPTSDRSLSYWAAERDFTTAE